jgi:hypothetical protein
LRKQRRARLLVQAHALSLPETRIRSDHPPHQVGRPERLCVSPPRFGDIVFRKTPHPENPKTDINK